MRAVSANASTAAVRAERELRTGAWHGDSPLRLEFPQRWKVTTHWPTTPPRLADAEIIKILETPVGQPAFRELLKGKTRPMILVDDLNRPTPAARILPALLKQFQAAGIALSSVTIIMARGSHGEPQRESMLRKIGDQAAGSCRFLLHDPYRDTVRIGKTSLGTPVYVSRYAREADFVMGIGGVYPNNTAGFGGGAKLAMGVLDIRVISQLHNKHLSVGWGRVGLENPFRRDVEEIAQMIGLKSMVIAQVDSDRELVRLRCGDYHAFFDEEMGFARQAFRAPLPGQADVVISNAFPNDLSLTFVHMKGVYPLRYARPGASRIAVAACSEGEGFHGVFPVVNKSRFHEQFDRLRRISLLGPREISRKMAGKVAKRIRGNGATASPGQVTAAPQTHTSAPAAKNPIWVFRTGTHSDILPSPVKEMRTLSDWQQILDMVRQEQNGREDLNVVIYPCAPLQVLE